ncbi:DUF1993 domain-containing protein [Prosthecomicrobium pneumaticum]|uniref:DUF1993 domain-containing protein n=1 Tax=Prosthecomicrobium pneumaticum TaxID=81895 RepID=A0A7W9CUD4_9HYPH|nr:DUF1993 domain-containing protein [Prosthecomicrobium pneumaticum]MBB5751809.1 hypothetical protein [Prosthecomicrobium pneumaticum]
MSLTLYDLTIPVYRRGFAVLATLLDKGEAHARDNGGDPEALVEARLAPDMLPLAGQIQRASDTAKAAVARLTATEAPRFADEEKSLAELKARIAATVAYLDGVLPEAFEGAAERIIRWGRGQPVEQDGRTYLLTFALPNFFFHLTTAYAILRHQGVPVGKMDYIGPL